MLTWQQAIQSGALRIDDPDPLFDLLGMMEGFDPMFNIVTP